MKEERNKTKKYGHCFVPVTYKEEEKLKKKDGALECRHEPCYINHATIPDEYRDDPKYHCHKCGKYLPWWEDEETY